MKINKSAEDNSAMLAANAAKLDAKHAALEEFGVAEAAYPLAIGVVAVGGGVELLSHTQETVPKVAGYGLVLGGVALTACTIVYALKSWIYKH